MHNILRWKLMKVHSLCDSNRTWYSWSILWWICLLHTCCICYAEGLVLILICDHPLHINFCSTITASVCVEHCWTGSNVAETDGSCCHEIRPHHPVSPLCVCVCVSHVASQRDLLELKSFPLGANVNYRRIQHANFS